MQTDQKVKIGNKIKTPFTWIENDLIRSKNISFQAMGLYLTLRSFGATSYPSVDYLCALGKIGRDKLKKIINELIRAKLLLKKQTKEKNLFSKTEYQIISVNDNYEEIYKEFIGEELKKPQTLDNRQSYPLTEIPLTEFTLTEKQPLIRIIDKEESCIKKNHTQKEDDEKAVCENEIEKIKKTKTFQNSDTAIIQNIIKKSGKEAVIAAEYIEKAFSGQAVRNPLGLLIKSLERGTYSELPPEKANNLNSEIGKLNAEYKGFTIFRNEKIKEFLNIGGRIAFNTDNCLREIIYTPAKSCEEFKSYLQEINSS